MQMVKLIDLVSSDYSSMPEISQISEDELICVVIGWVKENTQADHLVGVDLTPETDLISTGVLNSSGFIDLLLFIEAQANCKIDLTDVEPDKFLIVRGLCQLALRNGKGDAQLWR
jgi:acyl carrier protein